MSIIPTDAAAAAAKGSPRWIRGTSTTMAVDGSSLSTATLTQADLEVQRLPGTLFENPMIHTVDQQFREEMLHKVHGSGTTYIAVDPVLDMPAGTLHSNLGVQQARIRAKLHFDPVKTRVGIVTCGGLCPGLNDVVRAVTHACLANYGVSRVYGFRYGFWGLSAAGRHTALELSRSVVSDLHRHGGSFLGSSRGPQKPEEMLETLRLLGINVLMCVGGDGTQRGAMMLADAARARGLDIAVMGIPKTIDNDLSFSHRTFGFETAVEQAVIAIRAAHAEATSVLYGVGIVKVMGRHSGFIAAQATLASELVNLCFIPENEITLDVVVQLIETRFQFSTHCVICVAEGFGQKWSPSSLGKDDSGNQKLFDVGTYLTTEVGRWLKRSEKFKQGTVKYIDPSYMVRGCPPNTSDSAFCMHLANLAVHEAMHGTTNAIITYWYSNFVVVPTRIATALRRVVNVRGLLWKLVREVTVGLIPPEVLRARRRQLALNELRTAENSAERLKQMISKL